MRYNHTNRCCTICDAKKVCHVCGEQTLWACSDCRINFATTIYVCQKPACRDEHELKCIGDGSRHRAELAAIEAATIERCAAIVGDHRVAARIRALEPS